MYIYHGGITCLGYTDLFVPSFACNCFPNCVLVCPRIRSYTMENCVFTMSTRLGYTDLFATAQCRKRRPQSKLDKTCSLLDSFKLHTAHTYRKKGTGAHFVVTQNMLHASRKSQVFFVSKLTPPHRPCRYVETENYPRI